MGSGASGAGRDGARLTGAIATSMAGVFEAKLLVACMAGIVRLAWTLCTAAVLFASLTCGPDVDSEFFRADASGIGTGLLEPDLVGALGAILLGTCLSFPASIWVFTSLFSAEQLSLHCS